MPGVERGIEGALAANGINIDLESGKGFWEYPEDLRIFGVSAATNLFGWSTSAEFSYQENIPLMVNGNDLIAAGVLGIGPYRDKAAEVQAQSAGTYLIGHKRFTKRQFQANFVKTFSNFIGAETLLLVGEAGAQWNNVPDYTEGGIRYGRGFMYGTASGAATVRAAARRDSRRSAVRASATRVRRRSSACPFRCSTRCTTRSRSAARTTVLSPTSPGAIACACRWITTTS